MKEITGFVSYLSFFVIIDCNLNLCLAWYSVHQFVHLKPKERVLQRRSRVTKTKQLFQWIIYL